MLIQYIPEPSFFRGPRAFSRANIGKYMIENVTSRIAVAPIPRYRPRIPLDAINSRANDVAETLGTVFPSKMK